MVEARVRVIYGDTDQMGVVYHANYLRYFELARGEFLRTRHASYRDVEREGCLLPVVHVTCNYRAPARYDDMLVIRVVLSELKRASLTFSYELFREGEDKILCTGITVHACMNPQGIPQRIPEKMLRMLDEKA